MRGLTKTMIACLLLAAMWPVAAVAVDLSNFDYVDEAKKLTLTLTFSEIVDAQVIHNYAGNFVDIGIDGLKLPRHLTRKDHTPDDEATESFYRFTHFSVVDGEGHIRVQLGKYADPGDVQVVSLDERIVIDLVKPYYKLPPDSPAAVVPDELPEDSGLIADEQEPEPDPTPQDSSESTGGDLTEPFTSPTDLRGETPVTDEPAADPAEDTTGGLDDLQPADTTPPTDNSTSAQPVPNFLPGPSYKVFDLDDVPVAQLQLRNMPFNEALMELTAGSGFNVIVGAGVSDELMTLDFRQKELSLKRALDLLCMAYDLGYTVEDEAIVIRAN